MNRKMCFILNNVPDFRAIFLNKLCDVADVTVISGPCDGVTKVESLEKRRFNHVLKPQNVFFGLLIETHIFEERILEEADVIFVSANLHAICRGVLGYLRPSLREKIVWWGLFFSERESYLSRYYRTLFLSASSKAITHSQSVADRLSQDYGIDASSFNNSQTLEAQFSCLPQEFLGGCLKVLFVGTNKPRKKLDRLVLLAERLGGLVSVRVVGGGMETLELAGKDLPNFAVFPRAIGDELLNHFGWCNLVFSPGNMGLLVSMAARFGRAVICDNGSHHGPEVELAKRAGQLFVDASDTETLDQLFSRLLNAPDVLVEKGDQLCSTAKQYYSVEEMVRRHVAVANRLTGEI